MAVSSPLPFAWTLNPLSGLDKVFAPVRDFVASHMEFVKKAGAVVVMWHVATTVVKLAEPYIAQHKADVQNKLRLQKERREAAATLKAKYGAHAASMAFVSAVYQQYEQLRGEYPWNAVWRWEVWPAAPGGEGPKQKASAATTEASARSYLELAGHLNTLNGFWDEVQDAVEKDLFGKEEFKSLGWYRRWANYRHLCEPLFIANFYRSKFDHKFRQRHDEWAYTNPAGKKRPARYTYFEKQEFRPAKDDPLQDTLVWAREFESQLKAGKDRSAIDLSKLDPLGAPVPKGK